MTGKLYAGFYDSGECAAFPICQACKDYGVDDCASYREIVCTMHNRDETCSECERVVVPMPDGGPRRSADGRFGNQFDFADGVDN